MADYTDPQIFDNPPQTTLDDFIVDEIYDRLRPGSIERANDVAKALGQLYIAIAYYGEPDAVCFDDLDADQIEAMIAALDAMLAKYREL